MPTTTSKALFEMIGGPHDGTRIMLDRDISLYNIPTVCVGEHQGGGTVTHIYRRAGHRLLYCGWN